LASFTSEGDNKLLVAILLKTLPDACSLIL